MKKNKYVHQEEVHNLISPAEIVPVIYKLFQPKSVVDIGCGIGTFLHCFKKEGVNHILGVDGEWVNKKLLHKYINSDEFLLADLEESLKLDTQFDLVLSLEVAEHLKKESADIFVQNLISAGKLILFSAAIPQQGGQNHINEQWLDYWGEKFKSYDYVLHDVIKPLFWNNKKINWWYKQNMVLVAHKDYKIPSNLRYNILSRAIHYEQFEDKISTFLNGGLGPFSYLIGLFKSIKIRIMRILN